MAICPVSPAWPDVHLHTSDSILYLSKWYCSVLLQQQICFTTPVSPLSNRNRPHKSTKSHTTPLQSSDCYFAVIWQAYITYAQSCYRFWLHAHSSWLGFFACCAVFSQETSPKFGCFNTVLSGRQIHLELGRENAARSWPSTKDDDDENVVSDFSLVLPQSPTLNWSEWLELEEQSKCGQAGNVIWIKA